MSLNCLNDERATVACSNHIGIVHRKNLVNCERTASNRIDVVTNLLSATRCVIKKIQHSNPWHRFSSNLSEKSYS